MENRRQINFWCFLMGVIIFISPVFVFSYSDKTTHPALTDEVVDLFNYYYPEQTLNKAEKEALKKGSVEEDQAPRWMSHFYDPVHEQGLVLGKKWQKSKEWAKDTLNQAKYDPVFTASLGKFTRKLFSSKTDYSWERAVYEYAWQSKERGLESLGHILHLLEDATVPAHTRNDVHLPIFDMDSPYEEWTKQFIDKNLFLADKLIQENKKPIIYSNLDQYFNDNAQYSNNNFFSEDTIFADEYRLPKVVFEKIEKLKNGKDIVFFYGKTDASRFRLVGKLVQFEWQRGVRSDYFIDDPDSLILSDYWRLLSDRAVLSGAGAMKLFFDEVAEEKRTGRLLAKNKSFLNKIGSKFANVFTAAKNLFVSTSPPEPEEPTSHFGSVLTSDSEKPPMFEVEPRTLEPAGPAPELTLELTPELVQEQEQEITQPPSVPSAADNAAVIEDPAAVPVASVPEPSDSASDSVSDSSNDINVTTVTGVSLHSSGDVGSSLIPIPLGSAGAVGGGGAAPITTTSDVVAEQETQEIKKDTTPPNPPIIISPTPTELSQIFTTNLITFSGIVEASSMIEVQPHSLGTTTVDSEGNWSFGLASNQGTTTISFYATDAAGNVSSSTEISFFVDSIAPDILSLQISECGSSLTAGGCLLATTTLNLSWHSADEDLDFYELVVNSEVSTTTATSTVVLTEDNSQNIFSLRAKDKAGNWSEPKTIAAEISLMPVVINEIAWAGTNASAYDEWVELHNRTSHDIDLSSWVLYSQTDQSPYINLSGTIPAKGYYLIERKTEKKDNSQIFDNSGNSLADMLTSFSYGLNNTGEVLVLTRASTTIDQTVLCGIPLKWCGGSVDEHRTMERIDPDIAGSVHGNWRRNDGLIITGKDVNNDRIFGTVKARNSASHYIILPGASIDEDTTLTKDNSPYFVANNPAIIVKPGAALTIEPGVVIKFYNNAGMSIQGKIIAQGTEADPIVFTSFYDDEYGGDTNNNGTTTIPSAGSWYGVTVSDSTEKDSVFEHVIFRYAGKYYARQTQSKALLSIENSSVSVLDSVFEYSKVYGLKLLNSNSQVSNNVFRNNVGNSGIGDVGCGLLVAGGSPTIQNNSFISNQRGIYVSNSSAIIDSNAIASSTDTAIYSFGNLASLTNNTGSNNSINAITLSGSLVQKNSTSTLYANPMPYYLNNEIPIVAASSSLIIEKGVAVTGVKPLVVYGNLAINGENPEDIIFTSFSASPAPGQFPGIIVEQTGSLVGKGFTMRYAGGVGSWDKDSAGIKINGGLADISNAVFSSNYPHGIRAVNSENITIKNTLFENHTYDGLWGIKAALAIYNSTSTLTEIEFKNNTVNTSPEDLYPEN
jgi:hypothetical protein